MSNGLFNTFFCLNMTKLYVPMMKWYEGE